MKKQLILVILVSIFILTGCQFDQTNQASQMDLTTRQSLKMESFTLNNMFISEEKILVGLGDSLTQGVGDERKMGGYLGRFATEMESFQGVSKIDLWNEAKRGRRSDQLLKQIQSGEINDSLKKADVIVMTIGGNDIMRIVKQDLFKLRVDAFQNELLLFAKRYGEILIEIRKINPDAPLIILGLYNPFSIVTDEANEFDQILANWNNTINNVAYSDFNSCFVPVNDLFNSNSKMVYHTDFFHPNSKGYEQMTDRVLESLKSCGLNQLTKGEMDF
ncbi:MAG: GDSL-type esterase/lipase family protein [Paenisporosarcina sp.]